MADGLDTVADLFHQAIDPGQTADETPARAPAPRDTSGRFAVAEKPEPFLPIRMLEGDPETGDLSDGGDDPRLRERERGIADGRIDERAERQAVEDAKDARRDAAAGDAGEHETTDAEQGDGEAKAAEPEEGSDQDVDEDAQFEITVDGEPQVVSLGELRDGYIRTATFHSRLNKVNLHQQAVQQENQRVNQMRDLYINGLQFLDEDIRAITPQEPNWDEEFARDPRAAHARQKQFQEIYAKLHQVRSNRAWAIQNRQEEQDRASAQYAVEQFTEFVGQHPKLFKDEPSIQRIISGMRKAALAEGFNETEVAGVYDKRMLNVLLKSWLYDQGMAVKPAAQAALPGPKGTSLAPGSARPLSGSVGRRQVDEAQRVLARTGKLEDAQVFFQRLLR